MVASIPAPTYNVLKAVNHRFWSGGPSDKLAEAGVLVHMLDELHEPGEPWHACSTGWCSGFDRFSASLVNAQRRATFGGGKGIGFVLSPNTEFLCAYTKDGGTQGTKEHRVFMGGCCDRPACSPDGKSWGGCQWPRAMLRDAVTSQMRDAGIDTATELPLIATDDHKEPLFAIDD